MRTSQRTTLLSAILLVIVNAGAPGRSVAGQERQVITVDSGAGMVVGPGMMDPRQVKIGTGRIRGRILGADSGAPVRRVQVRVTGQNIAAKTMLTDADGRYEFRDLPAGRFQVSASKAGYVTVQFGQTRPYEAGKPIELAEAQLLDKADIALPRGSVIAGRIVDEIGEPVTDAMVSAMRSVWSGGRRRLQPAGRPAQTNDLGQFRIFGLPPGEYYVSATFRGGETMLFEIAAASVTGSNPPSAPTSGYAPTYFPGTTAPSDAQKIALALGQEMQGADFALAPVKLVKVSGTVVRADGRPAEGALVNLMPRVADNALFMMMDRTARTDRNGAFTITGVTSGDYTLQVRGMQMSISGVGDNVRVMMTTRIGGPDGGEEAEFGSVPVVVAGEDVANVVVVTSKGGTATGRVTFEGGTPQASSTMRITAAAADNDGPTMVFPGGPGSAPGTVQQDGSFELRGLAGTRLIRAIGLPSGWVLKAVRVEAQDVTDTGYDFKPGSSTSGLEVVLTNKTTDISGTVVRTDGHTVKDYTVVIFADDPVRWTFPNSRYVTATRPDQDGRFKVRNLPPGEYLAAAVEYLAQGEWGDPDVLERLRTKAARFTLAEGAAKTLELKMQ